MKITPVDPLGTQLGYAHVQRADGPHTWEQRQVPVYPSGTVARGRQLREQRARLGVTMGELARHLGVSVADVSRIERGEAFIEEGQDEWDAAIERLGATS